MSQRERLDRIAKLRHLRARVDAELRGLEKAVAGPNRRPRRREAICGTDGGYYRHRRKLQEKPCDACKAAHACAQRERERRRAARMERPEEGAA